MDREEAERLAWKILGEVEEVMGEEGVAVQARDPGDRVKVRAYFEDPEYKALEETIIETLLAGREVEPVRQAESLDGHDK